MAVNTATGYPQYFSHEGNRDLCLLHRKYPIKGEGIWLKGRLNSEIVKAGICN